jgi:hypothetical protein
VRGFSPPVLLFDRSPRLNHGPSSSHALTRAGPSFSRGRREKENARRGGAGRARSLRRRSSHRRALRSIRFLPVRAGCDQNGFPPMVLPAIGAWPSGKATDFDSVTPGSNPGAPTRHMRKQISQLARSGGLSSTRHGVAKWRNTDRYNQVVTTSSRLFRATWPQHDEEPYRRPTKRLKHQSQDPTQPGHKAWDHHESGSRHDLRPAPLPELTADRPCHCLWNSLNGHVCCPYEGAFGSNFRETRTAPSQIRPPARAHDIDVLDEASRSRSRN